MKKLFKVLAIILAAVIVVVGSYAAYVLLSYDRLEDNITLGIEKGENLSLNSGDSFRIVTYNIGFGAYSQDFSFFMDGGKESRARSKESCKENVQGAADLVAALNPDFVLFQEVDLNSTRSYHIDQYELLREAFPKFSSVKAINYDSAYLYYPLIKPHGKSLSGLAAFSKYNILDSVRRSLPIATDLSKLVDLDRCYSVSRIETDSGKSLYLYNVHLSAYGGDASIRTAQIKMLFEDIKEKTEQGNYVICGGDFNHDLPGNSAEVLNGADKAGEFSWAKPFPKELIPKGITMINNVSKDGIVPTARNCDIPYMQGETFVIVIDGFFVSSNIYVLRSENLQTEFFYSDHNPVVLDFKLI